MEVIKKNVHWIAVISLVLVAYVAYSVYNCNAKKDTGEAQGTGFGGKVSVKNPIV
jgi:hypothetical protein